MSGAALAGDLADDLAGDLAATLAATLLDVAPIVAVLAGFQFAVLRRSIPNLGAVLGGSLLVVLGLALFLFGLEHALFPIGRAMARELTAAGVVGEAPGGWRQYLWLYLFAFSIGFATTVAEPALIAVALKAEEVSGGTVSAFGLRIAVALGVAASLVVGVFRIVTGTPLHLYMIAGYLVVMAQTLVAPRAIIPLAYDSGGVTTSTVTVPLVTALGLGLASAIPGRHPLLDGFGLIALASLFPMITVMGYAQLGTWLGKAEALRRGRSDRPAGDVDMRAEARERAPGAPTRLHPHQHKEES